MGWFKNVSRVVVRETKKSAKRIARNTARKVGARLFGTNVDRRRPARRRARR
jgi:hypothetical protein